MNLQVLWSYIAPVTLSVYSSRVNGDIKVELAKGKLRISVNEFWQTGTYAERIAGAMLQCIHGEPRTILLLGVGGGTMLHVFRKRYPQSRLVGVEKDPVMLTIGRKYFSLDTIARCTLSTEDARTFVEKKKGTHVYDLIVSDVFVGCDVPQEVSTKKHLQGIKSLLAPKGVFLENRSNRDEYKSQLDIYTEIFRTVFPKMQREFFYRNVILRGSV